MKVVIMMGCSGSGKSTYVEGLLAHHKSKNVGRLNTGSNTKPRPFDAAILSADDVTFDEEGFHPELLGEAHARCLRAFNLALGGRNAFHEVDLLIVDNTNTSMAEVAPYVALALMHEKVELEVIAFDFPWQQCAQRNKHGTPQHIIRRQSQQMHKTLDAWPPFWPAPKFWTGPGK